MYGFRSGAKLFVGKVMRNGLNNPEFTMYSATESGIEHVT